MTKRKGLCCIAFPLPYGPEELDKIYNNELRMMGLSDMFGWMPAKQWDDGTMGGWTATRRVQGIERWWPWLKYVGTVKINPIDNMEYSKPLATYTCIKHDPETGDCTAYEDRPHFCRSYGSLEVPCTFASSECECGVFHYGEAKWKEALAKRDAEQEELVKEIEDQRVINKDDFTFA